MIVFGNLHYIEGMNYLRTHWRGEQPLFRSFWINFVALRLAIWFFPLHLVAPDPLPASAVIVLVAADFTIFVWQMVGLVRSAENHMLAKGGMAPTWGIYASIAVAVFGIATQWLGLYQMTLAKPDSELFTTIMDRQHAAEYDMAVSDDGKVLTFNGTIALGVTKAAVRLFEAEPDIRRIELQSTGGNIYEARGLAALLLPKRIGTHVEDECSSACTIVFMAGEERTLGRNAKLGFHAYRLDTDIVMPNVDVGEEQDRDRNFFKQRRLSEKFLARIYDREHTAIWFPERSELDAAGVTKTPGRNN
ncbi:hypothetical protein [Hoeflea sp. TYP-13]|uniref:hypothetical protein n=1 Tax=Hoeflea sp. TYP-13 TaxID=3230023 RepID=UPI0034C67A1E